MAWSDKAREAAAEARRRKSKLTKVVVRTARNLGSTAPTRNLTVAGRYSKKRAAMYERNLRMNLTPGGYAQHIYETRKAYLQREWAKADAKKR